MRMAKGGGEYKGQGGAGHMGRNLGLLLGERGEC